MRTYILDRFDTRYLNIDRFYLDWQLVSGMHFSFRKVKKYLIHIWVVYSAFIHVVPSVNDLLL